MRIICEGKDSVEYTYLVCDDDVYGKVYNTEYDYYRWEVVECPSCSKVNVLQHSSLAASEYFTGRNGETSIRPTVTDFLYPLSDPYKEKPLELKIINEVIERAIADVEASIHENKAISGVDRIHAALHGYFRLVCATENIPYTKLDNIVQLFRLLRYNHPKLQNTVNPRYINDFLQSVATIIDRINPIRNDASLAHGNENLLENDEALFYIDVVRLLIRYLDKKLMS